MLFSSLLLDPLSVRAPYQQRDEPLRKAAESSHAPWTAAAAQRGRVETMPPGVAPRMRNRHSYHRR